MPNSRTLSFLIVSSLALAVAACDDKPKAASQQAAPAEVTAETIKSQQVQLSTDLPGRTSAYRVAEVRPQVSGIILKRMFQEGSDVKAGQQLYQIDPATYEATVESAKANLAKDRATLKSVQAKASRYAELVQIDAVSKQDYDDAIATQDQDKAQIMVDEATLKTAQINLEYTKVYAPIAGRIGKSAVTEGALVTSSQATALTTITQLDPIYVDVSQSSAELLQLKRAIAAGAIQAGQAKVTLTMNGSLEPYGIAGKLQFSDVTVDPTSGAVQIRAVFPNPHHDLYPGLFVRARVEQGVKDNALLVPQRALVRNADGSSIVWVVGADSKVTPRPITVGQGVDDKWIVDQGLTDGEQVVIEGLQKIRPDAVVHVTQAVKTPSQH